MGYFFVIAFLLNHLWGLIVQGIDNNNPWQTVHSPQQAQQRRIIHSDQSASMIIQQMHRYWEGLRRDSLVPLRSDVSPQRIPHLLDYAFLLERIAPGAAKFRLSGRHLIEVTGTEIRGSLISMLMQQPSRTNFSSVLETVFSAPQIARITLTSKPETGRPGLSGYMLLLPLLSDLGDVSRILGCLVTQGDLGCSPRRFDMTRAEFIPVIPGGKVVKPELSKPSLSRPVVPVLRAKSEQTAQPNSEARRASFRLIPGGKAD